MEQSGDPKVMMPLEEARLRLARIWFIGAGTIFLLLIAQSIVGKYQGRAQEVWGWGLPAIVPALSLILSTLGAEALQQRQDQQVKSSFARIAAGLSMSYLGLILMTILVEPLTTFDSLELLKLSNLWLGPLQGIVISSIGVLFFSRRAKAAEPSA
jgi:hypothetical protein